MKNTTLADMPKHRCAPTGSPRLGFAPLDFDVMKAMIDRDAGKEGINRQVRAWIADDAAKNPNPIEPEEKRLREAIFSNNPFAVYCGACLTTICLIHPEQIEEDLRGDHR
jgi:hypothetical protein